MTTVVKYKAIKAFIYRARLYTVGQELTESEYERIKRDKVAIKRSIPEMIAPQEPQNIEKIEAKKPKTSRKKQH